MVTSPPQRLAAGWAFPKTFTHRATDPYSSPCSHSRPPPSPRPPTANIFTTPLSIQNKPPPFLNEQRRLFSVSTIKECHNLTSCTGCLRAERGRAGARSNFLRNGPCHGLGVLLNLRHIGKIGVRSDRASRQFPKIGHSSRAGARIIPVKDCPGYKPFFTGP